ncbi:MAG: SDR family NAD(P)-dependent oxidoreductase [Planctomycetota bacterium]
MTGGSAGLGLALARLLLQQGWSVSITGRNANQLQTAADQLGHVQTILADASDIDEANKTVNTHIEHFGRIDALFNVVGQSDRGRVESLSPDRLRDLLDTNVLTALINAQAALDHLRQTRGVIINVGSLAGCLAPGYLGGYVTAKHALRGLTRQMRMELRDSGVHVGMVCPGPIQRDDAGTRYQQSDQSIPDAAKMPGGGAKVKGLAPERVARAIVDCAVQRRIEVILPWKIRLLMMIDDLSPAWADRILAAKTAG